MPKPCDWDSRPYYDKLIEPLREEARRLGYAIGVHGTLKRDIDLIAVPWTAEAVDAKTLADALCVKIGEVNGFVHMAYHPNYKDWWLNGSPGKKSHGRLCWTILVGGHSYIDLSVTPRLTDHPADTQSMPRFLAPLDLSGNAIENCSTITAIHNYLAEVVQTVKGIHARLDALEAPKPRKRPVVKKKTTRPAKKPVARPRAKTTNKVKVKSE